MHNFLPQSKHGQYTAAPLPHLLVFHTWKRELWPCSLAGLSGATGLKLLQKWMPDNRGLWASSKPVGVCDGLDAERVKERNKHVGAERVGAARIAARAWLIQNMLKW